MQGARAPGRYHNAIVSPSPRIMVGWERVPLREEGCLQRTLISCCSFVPDCIGLRVLDNLIKSMPHETEVDIKDSRIIQLYKNWLTPIMVCLCDGGYNLVHGHSCIHQQGKKCFRCGGI